MWKALPRCKFLPKSCKIWPNYHARSGKMFNDYTRFPNYLPTDDPKGPPLLLFLQTSVFNCLTQIFLKAPLAPICTNFLVGWVLTAWQKSVTFLVKQTFSTRFFINLIRTKTIWPKYGLCCELGQLGKFI